MKIAYLLPDINISGGSAVVLRHLVELKLLGHDVCVVTMFGDVSEVEHKGILLTVKNYAEVKGYEFEILVATHWSTVKSVLDSRANRKIYFVQSDERRFGHESLDSFMECQKTYTSPMLFMTEAKWIQRWLKEEFDKDAYYVPNGIDTEIFKKNTEVSKHKKKRILVEGNVNLAFKGVMLALMAVQDIPDTEVWLVSSYGIPPKDYRYDKFLHSVPLEQMKDIYSSCDVFIKMSRVEGFFGPPLEAMACGTPVVVAKCTGYDEYIKDGYNALVVNEGDYLSARDRVLKILNDKQISKKLIKNGISTSKEWDWGNTVSKLTDVINGKPIKIYYSDTSPDRYEYRSGTSTALYTIELNAVINQNKIKPLMEEISKLKSENIDLNNKVHLLRQRGLTKLAKIIYRKLRQKV